MWCSIHVYTPFRCACYSCVQPYGFYYNYWRQFVEKQFYWNIAIVYFISNKNSENQLVLLGSNFFLPYDFPYPGDLPIQSQGDWWIDVTKTWYYCPVCIVICLTAWHSHRKWLLKRYAFSRDGHAFLKPMGGMCFSVDTGEGRKTRGVMWEVRRVLVGEQEAETEVGM